MATWIFQSLFAIAGGLFSWAWAEVMGVPAVPNEAKLNAVVVVVFCMLAGLISGHLGPIVLGTLVENPKTRYKLAIYTFLFGFGWRGILDASLHYASVRSANSEVTSSTAQLVHALDKAAKLPGQDQARTAITATEIGSQAEKVLTISNVTTVTPNSKEEAAGTVKIALDTLSGQARQTSAPVESVDWIFKVGQTSKQLKNEDVQKVSVKQLDFLAVNAANPEIRDRAKELSLKLK